MRTKISNLTKKVLPFLAIPFMVSSVYGVEKKLDENFLFKSEIPKFEETDYSRGYKLDLYENFSKKDFGTSYKNIFSISVISSGKTGSHHFKGDYNENNGTFGFKIQPKKSTLRSVSLSMAKFTNSYGYPSRAILFNWEGICSNTLINFCGGLSTGLVDGYPQFDFKPTLVLLPYSSIKYKDICGIDLYITSSAVAFNANLKLLEF